jgi:hypothetical protein
MDEGDMDMNRSKVPIYNGIYNLNAPVMKQVQDPPPIEFIEKVMYVDRKPFLGMDRGAQTDPINMSE